MYVTDPFESKYQSLMNGRQKVGIKKFKIPKAFIHYSQTTDDVHENLEDYNPTKRRKVLIVLSCITADMEANKTLSPKVTILFLRGRKLNILLAFILRSYSKVPKTTTLNATHHFIMKIANKRKLQENFIFSEPYNFTIR